MSNVRTLIDFVSDHLALFIGVALFCCFAHMFLRNQRDIWIGKKRA